MYLARFELGAARIVQGCVRVPWLPPLADGQRDAWWREFDRVARGAASVPAGVFAMRLLAGDAGRNGAPERLLFSACPDVAEPELRRHLAGFTRLEYVVDGSVQLPRDRAAYDEWASAFPRLQCRVGSGGFQVADAWFACDFRVFPLLDELLDQADALGHRVGYQAVLTPLSVEPHRLRDARKNVLRVRGLPGVPADAVAMQQRLADSLATANALLEEFLGVDTPAAAQWLGAALGRHFARCFGRMRFAPPSFEFVDGLHQDLIAAAMHSSMFAETTLEELCAGAVDDSVRPAVLGWRPSDALAKRFAGPTGPRPVGTTDTGPFQEGDSAAETTAVAVAAANAALPEPYEGASPFLFVSYKRQDLPRIAPVLQWLARNGFHFWYDRGIPGGAEWDALLEEKVAGCGTVLLFVSQASVRSKYVRREVKFADMLDKPILSVKLEDASLSGGMGMLLTQYQMIDARGGDFTAQLRRAIHYTGGRSQGPPG